MPWKERCRMSLKRELVELMGRPGANVSELCGRYGVSRKTAYKWFRRYKERGEAGLAEKSRRPGSGPKKTKQAVESAVLALRDLHPAWGPRKLVRRLRDTGREAVPAPSTVGAILKRNGRVTAAASEAASAYLRFERPCPNDLWQGDFKGYFELLGLLHGDKARCHPLTVLDDHSRFNLVLAACTDQTAATVRTLLTAAFRRYGLPRAMLFDNGPPWGCSHTPLAYTATELWLMRLGVLVLHGRPYHPQTQGKEERFHRTLQAEALQGRSFGGVAEVQSALDAWRHVYNLERPHEALGLATPATRYAPSPRRFPETLPELAYGAGDAVRAVNGCGFVNFGKRRYFLGEGFAGQRVGLRPTADDGVLGVYYGRFEVGRLDEREGRVEAVRRREQAWEEA
jgi:transposase InsO family protein